MNGRQNRFNSFERPCPHPEKTSFQSKHDAKTWLTKNHKKPPNPEEINIYHCGCGKFHYTRMPLKKMRSAKMIHEKGGEIKLSAAFARLLR